MTNTNIAKLVSTFSDGQNLPILQTLRRERLICKLKKLRKTLYYRCDSITTVSKNSKFLLTLTFVLSLSKLYFLFDESVEFSPFILEISISPFNSYHLGYLVFLNHLFVCESSKIPILPCAMGTILFSINIGISRNNVFKCVKMWNMDFSDFLI